MIAARALGRTGRQEEFPVAGPLLGQVVLEMLHFLVDCKNQRLVPRPESPNGTFYRLK